MAALAKDTQFMHGVFIQFIALTLIGLSYASVQIPVVPLKQVRNIFENLALNSSYESSPVQPSKVTRERSIEKTNAAVVVQRGDDTNELDVVQCSSTVFVIEDELPPAAITRSILAKFRQLESGNEVHAVPMPTKSSLSRNSSTSKRAERDTNETYKRSRSTVDDISPVKQSSVERDASRSEASAPELDYSNGGDSPADELPLQGCAKSLLARWRVIEREATARGSEETMAKKRPSSSRRSQSMSRVEVRQRKARPSSDEDEDDGSRFVSICSGHIFYFVLYEGL